MADDLPPLDLGLDDKGAPVVLLGRAGEAADMPGLLRLAKGMASPAHAAHLARAANHLAHGSDYRVILDPQAFAAAYRARLAQEDPQQEWREGVMRLSDFGVPDFASITPPRLEAGKLTFFAEDSFTGLPYQAETADLKAAPSYTPVPLTPLPRPGRPAGMDEVVPPTAAEEEAFRTVRSGEPERPPE